MLILQITSDELYEIIYKSSTKAVRDQLAELSNGTKEHPSTKDTDRYLTKKEAAKIASVSTSTIDNWARGGKIKRYYFGASVRFHHSELMEFLKTSKVG